MQHKFNPRFLTYSKRIVAVLLAFVLLSLNACIIDWGDEESQTSHQTESKRESSVESNVDSHEESSELSEIESEFESDLESESEAESESAFEEESQQDSEEESEPESEPEPSWTEGLPIRKDVSEAVLAVLPESISSSQIDYWHTTMLVSTRIFFSQGFFGGMSETMNLVRIDLATNVSHSLTLEKHISSVSFLQNGYVFYMYIENSHIQIVILNQSLEEDSVYPLETLTVSEADLTNTWLDSKAFTWYFQLANGSKYSVNLLDGTLNELDFDHDILAVSNGFVYYSVSHYLYAYNPTTGETKAVECEYDDYFTNRGSFFMLQNRVNLTDNCSFFAAKDWDHLGHWNVFVSDNIDALVIGSIGNIMFVDAPEYPEEAYLPTGRTILAIDTESGLVISRYSLDPAYYESNLQFYYNQYSAVLCLFNSDGILDSFKMWNFTNDTSRSNVQAFEVKEYSLTNRVQQEREDLAQLSGFTFGDYQEMFAAAKDAATGLVPMKTNIERFMALLVMNEIFTPYSIDWRKVAFERGAELLLVRSMDNMTTRVSASDAYPHNMYVVNFNFVDSALPLMIRG